MSKEKYFATPPTSQSHFSNVPSANIERSRFDRSHGYKSTFDAGRLIPIFVDEVLPGDTFNLKSRAFARLATPLKPIMDNIYLDTHYFFVPNRLLWDQWQEFCGERKSPTDDPSDHTIPQTVIDLNDIDENSIAGYMGLPQKSVSTEISVSALPFRAYQLIYNEWYRDENLQTPVTFETGPGPDIPLVLACFPRGKRKDYFTSALPWPQKGDPVSIPIGDTADVVGTGSPTFDSSTGSVDGVPLFVEPTTNNVGLPAVPPTEGNLIWNNPQLQVDLTTATSVTINDLRAAFQIQKLLERDARGGTRYIELILSHFGVTSDDARLQRPEYLGGGSTMLNINPVSTTFENAETPLGQLAAVGTGINDAKFNKSFTEHGVIIGLISARADLTYQQGIERFWFRETRYDFYWPAFAHLGEQAIFNREIYTQGTADDGLVFGYQERSAEYRYKPSRVTGLFSSENPASLDVWHLSQDFESLPLLNESFIQEQPPIDRIVAVPSEPDFLVDIWFNLECQRPMPVYSVPGLIDHF